MTTIHRCACLRDLANSAGHASSMHAHVTPQHMLSSGTSEGCAAAIHGTCGSRQLASVLDGVPCHSFSAQQE